MKAHFTALHVCSRRGVTILITFLRSSQTIILRIPDIDINQAQNEMWLFAIHFALWICTVEWNDQFYFTCDKVILEAEPSVLWVFGENVKSNLQVPSITHNTRRNLWPTEDLELRDMCVIHQNVDGDLVLKATVITHTEK